MNAQIDGFVAVDETTGKPNEDGLRLSRESWGGRSLLRIDVGDFSLPQDHTQAFFDAKMAEEIGSGILVMALEGQLLDAGWRPAEPDTEGRLDGDWAPPEDRTNLCGFEDAVAEMRRRRVDR